MSVREKKIRKSPGIISGFCSINERDDIIIQFHADTPEIEENLHSLVDR